MVVFVRGSMFDTRGRSIGETVTARDSRLASRSSRRLNIERLADARRPALGLDEVVQFRVLGRVKVALLARPSQREEGHERAAFRLLCSLLF